jgi:hypothetical protein
MKEHDKVYENEMEYRGIVAYEKARFEVAVVQFKKNPNSTNYSALEYHMLLYQNISCNCDWDRENL